MEQMFKVSEKVLVEVKGFEPWPATIENVVSEENINKVSYHVRLDGSSKSVPISAKDIKPFKEVDAKKWSSLCHDEKWHGARKRNEVVEGVCIDLVDEDIPSSLWNYVAVDSDYENVSDVDKANLKLSRVAHNAKIRYKELETKFTFHSMQNKMLWGKKDETDEYEHSWEKTRRKSACGSESKTLIRFPCLVCSKKYKTRMALKKHLEYSTDCTEMKNRGSKITDQPQQCPVCFALYKNEATLLKHMHVHDKCLPKKKKNGIRDYIRQIMSTSKSRVAYNPSNCRTKAATTNGKTISRVSYPKRSKISSPEDSEPEDGDSDDISTSDTDSLKASWQMCRICLSRNCKCSKSKMNRDNDLHSEREKLRRHQMKQAFQNLADILGVDNTGQSKNTLLTLARDEIANLEETERKYERTLNDLQDMNIRLVSREYQLNMMKDSDVDQS